MGDKSFRDVVEEMKPAVLLVLVQVASAVLNILYKLALNDGMDARVLVAYRYVFAVTFIGPLAFFLGRKGRPKLTWMILLQSFLSGLFGLEILGIRTASGQAKVLGTLVGLGGATFLTLYKGPEINAWSTNLNLVKLRHPHQAMPHKPAKQIMGALLVIVSCFCYSLWLIIQTKMSKVYPCYYSSSALMSLMGAIQAIVIALCTNRDMNQWKLGFNIRLLTVAYTGIFVSGLIITVVIWCVKKKGPLYTSAFNPLQLVVVALLSSPLLGERLHLGCVLGAVLIIIGLYSVLWGKKMEATVVAEQSPTETKRESVEVVIVPGSAEFLGAKNISDPNNKEEETLTLGPKNVCLQEEETKANVSMP